MIRGNIPMAATTRVYKRNTTFVELSIYKNITTSLLSMKPRA
jgi:hypothetical protein